MAVSKCECVTHRSLLAIVKLWHICTHRGQDEIPHCSRDICSYSLWEHRAHTFRFLKFSDENNDLERGFLTNDESDKKVSADLILIALTVCASRSLNSKICETYRDTREDFRVNAHLLHIFHLG